MTMQKAAYGRRGFVESPLRTVKIMMRPLNPDQALPDSIPGKLIDARYVPKHLLVQFELKYTGFERPQLWSNKHLLNRTDFMGLALATSMKPTSVDDLLALVVNRRCAGGVRIGPVYACDAASAEYVLCSAMRDADSAVIEDAMPGVTLSGLPDHEILDKATLAAEVWGGNPEAVKLFEKLCFKPVGVE